MPENSRIKMFYPKSCRSIVFFQSREEMKETSDAWGLTPIIGLDDDDAEKFPGVFAAIESVI